MNLLKNGSRGELVKELQLALNIDADGIFGPNTEKAVREFQEQKQLAVDGIVGSNTWEKLFPEELDLPFTKSQIEAAVKSKGYDWFERGDFNLNIVGVRNSSTEGRITNHYDDHMTLSYNIDGKEQFHIWPVTTDPGLHWINHPMNRNGCAILVPGQYKGVYKIDGHGKTKYEALCQRLGKVRVYRDGDKDDEYDHDMDSITEGYYGINIHRSSAYKIANVINKYSAGCQVFADPDDFDEFMDICRMAAEKYGNKFTYTLIESKDIE
jgi:hypothetical protein